MTKRIARNPSPKASIRKNQHEKHAWVGDSVVVGLDEVGRGCLAGPVVTAAVILPKNKPNRLLKDSKLMTLEERLKAFEWIKKHCFYSIGMAHHRIIDTHNIYQSTLIAMQKALINLLAIAPEKPSAILIDAMPLKINDTAFKDIPIYHFYKGEKYSSSVAAASIVAKVTRDTLMQELDPLFPGYKLGQHKGYCTALHKTAVRSLGKTIIHRHSFLRKIFDVAKPAKQFNLYDIISDIKEKQI